MTKAEAESTFGLSPKEKGALTGIIWYYKEHAEMNPEKEKIIESIVEHLSEASIV